MKQKIRRKHPHRVKFLQMKKEYRMCNQSIKDLSESIDKLTRAIKKANDCPVLKCPKWLCWCTVLCFAIYTVIAIFTAGYLGYLVCTNTPIDRRIIIVLSIFLCLSILSIINLIYTLKINRQTLLKNGYNDAINTINQNIYNAEEKMKYTAVLYQHYCQSLTKR